MDALEIERLQGVVVKSIPQLLEGEVDRIDKSSGGWKLTAYRIKGVNPLIRIDIKPKPEKGD